MAALVQREVIELRIDALLGDVDTLIGQLDRLDDDPDIEPNGDELDCAWTEPSGRQLGQAWTVHNEDAEEDDFGEDDDPAGGSADDVGEVDEDSEREQMIGDVPCVGVYAIEPDLLDGKRQLLGLNCSNPDAFVGNGNKVRFA